jgi:hypothetical protein
VFIRKYLEISRQPEFTEEEAERVVFLVEFFINITEPENGRGPAVKSCSM